jgi:mRNA interferase MazF
VKRTRYIPAQGDLVWLDFSPQAGHEQAGRRPALILSPIAYNRRTGLALVCPLTRQAKGYPFEVPLPTQLPITGVVLSDHLKNQDWQARRAEFIASLDEATLSAVLERARTLLSKEQRS